MLEYNNGEFSGGKWIIDWETGYIKAVDFDYREPQETSIANVYIHDLMEMPDETGLANARLILAAPEMYSLLVEMVKIHNLKAETATDKNDPAFKKALMAQDGAVNMARKLIARIDGTEDNND